MKIYRVGGAVRDSLLGDAVVDCDWVVVGATADDMLARGYRPVGRDFPVFLHPETHQEYALARTERKTGPGYRGFECNTDPTVTLAEDLGRRDLTINAMAEDDDGTLIDPFGGRGDLADRILRHVSPAFAEDPVRILRVARFSARLADKGFTVAPETQALMTRMVAAGEVDHLVAERTFSELDKALGERHPAVFIRVLRDCGALARLLPEVDALFGIPQPEAYHPEIDVGEHVLLTLEAAAAASAPKSVRFACLVHDLGKGLTPPDQWPSHRGHETSGLAPVSAVCERFRVPKVYRELALKVCEHHLRCHRVLEMRSAKVWGLIEALDGLRQPTRIALIVQACAADLRGRTGFEARDYPQGPFLMAAAQAAAEVTSEALRGRGLEGPALGQALRQARIEAIQALKRPST